ncbi:AbrB/MazE/SpoVT family DNA-binding domain-containing protein [Photobacterium sp. ZSDE20]|uniref:AbrB/MazE/SpoVT family DNA-binding domain-containing protein n=1 Tax=Photobacterium pectinilyticum TaxID=2906793 RepID=A0ABT1NCY9_9GAMM|nr:AbrB/MazE/SpoVT family DNA-binding domain-containing protein [Photobacterium sp. ZSDE20]MCQ1061209.1 AbrB/MazE/SpoVT family DNA-binding domain-containing protein [Photobacterium sp. ZSDE20]MDD1829578.1 AbrB/MazE/SpoVT family DNA-binding domain-containing protein [Photobacterium sp. ZSDE20]
MAKVTSRRRITLPIDLCIAANINAGDDVETFVDRQGVISIVKQQAGAAKGILKNTPICPFVNENDLESGI